MIGRAIGRGLIFGFLVVNSISFGAPQTWDYAGAGQWQQVANPSTAPASDPTLDRVEQLLEDNQAKQAKELALSWYKAHKTSPLVDRAIFLIADAENRSGDGIRAFYYYDQLLDEHPESRLYALAMQKQYDIADSFLRGRKRKFLGLPILGAEDEAIEMMYRIQQRSPGSPIAEKSLLRTADYYFADRQYDLAEDAYAAFVRQYSRSPSVPRARLKQAYSAYALFHGPRFEVTPLIDARERLTAVMLEYPQLAEQENLPAIVEEIDRAMARKLYLTADFYKRTGQPRAAAYGYRYLIRAYPDSRAAQQAKAELQKLPPYALELPEPKVQQDAPALRSAPIVQPKVR